MSDTKEVIEFKENALLVLSNEITEANYKLTVAEQKFMLALISQIDNRKDHFENIKISAKSLSDACGFTQKNGYQQLQQVIKKIFNRSIMVKKRNGAGFQLYNWVQFCDYFSCKDDNGADCSHIEFELDTRLCPHFLQLKNRFLEIGLNHLISFTHIYSIRFYVIFRNLVNNLPKCTKKYTFSEIIKMFQLSLAYQNTVNLKNRVIKASIDEINEKSDIAVEYEYYRESGRAHVGIIFTFWKKEKNNQKEMGTFPPKLTPSQEKPISTPTVFSEEKDNWSDEQQADYDSLVKYGVWPDRAKNIIATYGHAQIERNVKGCVSPNFKGNIKSLGAVLANAIINDTYQLVDEEKRKAAEREQECIIAEYQQMEKDRKEKEEKIITRNKELARIREQYTAEELENIMEELKVDYQKNNENFTDEISIKLKQYGIDPRHFISYVKGFFHYKNNNLRKNKLEKIGEKEIDLSVNFTFDGSPEAIEKVIKIYFKNNKKCPDSVLKQLNKKEISWTQFQTQYFNKFLELAKMCE